MGSNWRPRVSTPRAHRAERSSASGSLLATRACSLGCGTRLHLGSAAVGCSGPTQCRQCHRWPVVASRATSGFSLHGCRRTPRSGSGGRHGPNRQVVSVPAGWRVDGNAARMAGPCSLLCCTAATSPLGSAVECNTGIWLGGAAGGTSRGPLPERLDGHHGIAHCHGAHGVTPAVRVVSGVVEQGEVFPWRLRIRHDTSVEATLTSNVRRHVPVPFVSWQATHCKRLLARWR